MRNNETGRSMVEMLGVLAIIGVLSVGGIAGYTMAMDKYRANEVLNTISMAATVAHAKNAGEGLTSGNASLADLGLSMPAGISGTIQVTGATSGAYAVTFSGGTGNVCKNVKAAAPVQGTQAAERVGWYFATTSC